MASADRGMPVLLTQMLPFASLLAVMAVWLAPGEALAQSLRGSPSSLDRQVAQADAHGYTYMRSAADVSRFFAAGLLVRLKGNDDYELKDVSFPYARPEVKLFVERLSSQFRAACGERLVITSLTRPSQNQPRNASARSVHPTGMALDIRRHDTPACRQWLERVLLSLERSAVLEVTLEKRPPHYHLALFPQPYADYVASLPASTAASSAKAATTTSGENFRDLLAYTVRRKDTLWRIAQNHGSTPEAIRAANGLRSTTIHPGQVLKIPVGAEPH